MSDQIEHKLDKVLDEVVEIKVTVSAIKATQEMLVEDQKEARDDIKEIKKSRQEKADKESSFWRSKLFAVLIALGVAGGGAAVGVKAFADNDIPEQPQVEDPIDPP